MLISPMIVATKFARTYARNWCCDTSQLMLVPMIQPTSTHVKGGPVVQRDARHIQQPQEETPKLFPIEFCNCFCSCKAEPWGTFMDSEEKAVFELLFWLVFQEVELVEAGVGGWESWNVAIRAVNWELLRAGDALKVGEATKRDFRSACAQPRNI